MPSSLGTATTLEDHQTTCSAKMPQRSQKLKHVITSIFMSMVVVLQFLGVVQKLEKLEDPLKKRCLTLAKCRKVLWILDHIDGIFPATTIAIFESSNRSVMCLSK
eukprot:334229_1